MYLARRDKDGTWNVVEFAELIEVRRKGLTNPELRAVYKTGGNRWALVNRDYNKPGCGDQIFDNSPLAYRWIWRQEQIQELLKEMEPLVSVDGPSASYRSNQRWPDRHEMLTRLPRA